VPRCGSGAAVTSRRRHRLSPDGLCGGAGHVAPKPHRDAHGGAAGGRRGGQRLQHGGPGQAGRAHRRGQQGDDRLVHPEPAVHKDTPFEATYTTTGSSPSTVVYAVDPPSGGLAFHETQTGSSAPNVQVIINSSGECVCNQSGSGGAWSCQKLGKADAATENQIFDIYTPPHWVSFLKGVSLVAGLAGDKVTTSTMSLNGFDVNCVDLVAKGAPGTSTICSTPQGILGYVKAASDSTSFQITNFSSSPASSLFELPPGATVTTLTTLTTPTTPTT
jgi:hypothetical protein